MITIMMPELVWHSADAPQIWRSWSPPGDDDVWTARKATATWILTPSSPMEDEAFCPARADELSSGRHQRRRALFACCLSATAASVDGFFVKHTQLLLLSAKIGGAAHLPVERSTSMAGPGASRDSVCDDPPLPMEPGQGWADGQPKNMLSRRLERQERAERQLPRSCNGSEGRQTLHLPSTLLRRLCRTQGPNATRCEMLRSPRPAMVASNPDGCLSVGGNLTS